MKPDPSRMTPLHHFEIGALSLDEAREIANWQYSGDYALYNTPAARAAEAPGYMLDPRNGFRAVRDGQTLIGFCSFGMDARVLGPAYTESALDIGAGMDPVLAGRGHGRQFIGTIVRQD
jgi:ribosomal-protein-alanine N-acetyltransferase